MNKGTAKPGPALTIPTDLEFIIMLKDLKMLCIVRKADLVTDLSYIRLGRGMT
jgi:hypothetical protein